MRTLVRAAAALARHPSLWGTALRQWHRMTPQQWWRRAPFLPVPDRRYMEFRLQTQYGSAGHLAEPSDVIGYLRWCRDWG